jgi:hypothetical protein
MSTPKANWLKGNLPTWLGVGLLSVNMWFIQRYVSQMDANDRALFAGQYDHEKRITRIESTPRMLGWATPTNISSRAQ